MEAIATKFGAAISKVGDKKVKSSSSVGKKKFFGVGLEESLSRCEKEGTKHIIDIIIEQLQGGLIYVVFLAKVQRLKHRACSELLEIITK